MISKVLSAALIEPTKLKRHVAELSKQDGWLGNPDTLYWCLARPICFATRAGSQVVRGILNPQHPLYTGGGGGGLYYEGHLTRQPLAHFRVRYGEREIL